MYDIKAIEIFAVTASVEWNPCKTESGKATAEVYFTRKSFYVDVLGCVCVCVELQIKPNKSGETILERNHINWLVFSIRKLSEQSKS